jgi:cellulose biosynthesis protein BcsQ
MSKPDTTVVYSEAGGATKTTTAVSLAVALAEQGNDVTLIDLDPRGASTKWLGVEPSGPGLHVGAILADPNPDGWVDDLAVQSPWKRAGALRIVPSHRQVSNREKSSEDHAELRLLQSLQGVKADRVIIDAPNRQGGPLIQNALNAADRVIYAGKLDEDGLDGVDGARTSVARFKESRRMLGAALPHRGRHRCRCGSRHRHEPRLPTCARDLRRRVRRLAAHADDSRARGRP